MSFCPVKSKNAFALLVQVPEHVHADGVHTQRTAHPDAVFPVFARYSGVMQLGGFYYKGLAVEQECTVACGERAAVLRRAVCRKADSQCGCDDELT